MERRSIGWLAAILVVLGAAAVYAQPGQAPAQAPHGKESAFSPAQQAPSKTAPGDHPTQAAVQEPIDLSYLTNEATAVLVAHPRRVLTAPEMEMLPTEVISAAGKKELGIDPVDVERLLAFAEAPLGPAPPQVAIVAHLSKPYSLATVLPALSDKTTEVQVDGKPYRRASGPMAPSIFMPDDRTLIVASEPVLQKIVARKAGASPTPLTRLVQGMFRGQDLLVVLSIDPIRADLNAQLAQAPLPPAMQELKEVPDLTSAVAGWMRLTGGRSEMYLGAKARDPQAAERLEAIVNHLIDTGSRMMAAQMGGTKESDDPVEQAMAQYAARMNARMSEMLRPKRTGDRLDLLHSEGQAALQTAGAGVAIAMILPAVQSAREAARRAQSMNNLKMIGLAMHIAHDATRHFPAGASYDKAGQPLLSWRVHILPYVDQQALYDQFHLDEPWDSPHNRALIEKMPAIYARPGSEAPPGQTTYLAVTGEGTVLGDKEGMGMSEITDGLSNTILVVEANDDRAVPWTKPEDLVASPDNPMQGLGAARPGGFNALLCDGAVRFLSATIDRQTLRAMFTCAGGEVVAVP